MEGNCRRGPTCWALSKRGAISSRMEAMRHSPKDTRTPGSAASHAWTSTFRSVGATKTSSLSEMDRSRGNVRRYALPPSSLNPFQQVVFQAMAQRVAAVGEPWQTFFDPHSLVAELRSIGFVHVEDVGPRELNKRFFDDRINGLRVGGLAHLMKASL